MQEVYLTARKIVSSPNYEELERAIEQLASQITNPQWHEDLSLISSSLYQE